MKFHLKLLLLLVNQIRGLMTGHHMMITLSLKLQTSYFILTRCLQVISTSFLTSGQHLLLLMTTRHPFPPLLTCTTQLMQLLLAIY